jgi:hypothetical protein
VALNLKNPRTLEAIDELARRTGLSKSEAVASAVEEHLAELLRKEAGGGAQTADERLTRIQALALDSGTRFAAAGAGRDPATGRFPDLTEDLYDAAGLPR